MTGSAPRSYGRKSITASMQPRDLMAQETLANRWTARVLTLFPEAFPGVLDLSLTGRALREEKWQLSLTHLREFGVGKHRNVDDTPAGGGAGMVIRPDVVANALQSAPTPGPLIYVSPRGKRFDQAMARDLAAGPGATFLCGRFEGVDQRVLDHFGFMEVSLGDFVLTGGEMAAQVMIDASVRLLPGVLGNADSTEEESHSNGLLEHSQYTRPAEWEGHAIPPVLMSGHHGEVAKWRRAQSEELTRLRRPDLWDKFSKGE